eukprot:CAMPEP_0176367944 /NCGR_PEP_ID=MMETSP0126-20121128/22245_1 /TAXON_ID=141414 ORGANISM="Strombidinopsis acuminatum, Strain SPMC142" /NCGR_SAMPLE_ID=MMETSP0126 /ASSEMBLY_ACC=CAM_ASM_000229 /LENGTH=183 /DNA_ID=CAMNT_0017725989 /DNA_START=18 /DNA_END=572 /DNA_ORIENTATION=-
MDNTSAYSEQSRMRMEAGPVVHPRLAAHQRLRTAQAEIEELRQSLRYVEISLTKSKEEKEMLEGKLDKAAQDHDATKDLLAAEQKVNADHQYQIEMLQKKIGGFSKNQNTLVEKNRFKAGNYLGDLNDRAEELKNVKNKLIDQDEEMKSLSLTREKFRIERDFATEKLKDTENQLKALQAKYQ